MCFDVFTNAVENTVPDKNVYRFLLLNYLKSAICTIAFSVLQVETTPLKGKYRIKSAVNLGQSGMCENLKRIAKLV